MIFEKSCISKMSVHENHVSGCMIFEIDLANHASGRWRCIEIMYLDTGFPNYAKHLTICHGWTEYLETGILRKVGV